MERMILLLEPDVRQQEVRVSAASLALRIITSIRLPFGYAGTDSTVNERKRKKRPASFRNWKL
jgi:hypothetical protein